MLTISACLGMDKLNNKNKHIINKPLQLKLQQTIKTDIYFFFAATHIEICKLGFTTDHWTQVTIACCCTSTDHSTVTGYHLLYLTYISTPNTTTNILITIMLTQTISNNKSAL